MNLDVLLAIMVLTTASGMHWGWQAAAAASYCMSLAECIISLQNSWCQEVLACAQASHAYIQSSSAVLACITGLGPFLQCCLGFLIHRLTVSPAAQSGTGMSMGL